MKENILEIEKFLAENNAVFKKLTEFMCEYNQKVNLTRITEENEVVEKHYIDSILPLTLYSVPRGTTLLDIGSGAGFPGIPMKLYRPDLNITLLDSAKKRTDYLKAVTEHIGVSCGIVTGRSEELSHNSDYRERYDVVTARAVANLASLCEYCLPFVKAGGVFLAMKGGHDETEAEIDGAVNAVAALGGGVKEVIKYVLPSGAERCLVVVGKITATSTKYPRKRVNITKLPIE